VAEEFLLAMPSRSCSMHQTSSLSRRSFCS